MMIFDTRKNEVRSSSEKMPTSEAHTIQAQLWLGRIFEILLPHAVYQTEIENLFKLGSMKASWNYYLNMVQRLDWILNLSFSLHSGFDKTGALQVQASPFYTIFYAIEYFIYSIARWIDDQRSGWQIYELGYTTHPLSVCQWWGPRLTQLTIDFTLSGKFTRALIFHEYI